MVWDRIRKLRGNPRTRPLILTDDTRPLVEPSDVSEAFASYFAKRSDGTTTDALFEAHRTRCELSPVTFNLDNQAAYNAPFTLAEQRLALSSCTSRSPGLDFIPYSFLQEMSSDQHHHLLHFYNYIYQTGFPSQWNAGQTVPVPKPGGLSSHRCYFRPITLVNCLSKVLEKMVNHLLQAFLESSTFYSPVQSGFRAGHSTLESLTVSPASNTMPGWRSSGSTTVSQSSWTLSGRLIPSGTMASSKNYPLAVSLATWPISFKDSSPVAPHESRSDPICPPPMTLSAVCSKAQY